jgi:putative FmdB family regulatory protein
VPIYEYEAANPEAACERCRDRFEVLQRMSDPPLAACPVCGEPVRRVVAAPSVGGSRSGLDDRAKAAGFHKLQRLGRGEYEKKY